MKPKHQILLTLLVLSGNLVIDRITKLLAISYLKGQDSIAFFYHSIVLSYAENTGAFLSAGTNWPVIVKYALLLVLPVLVCFIGLYYCAFRLTDRKQVVAYASIIGGGLGNLIDRLIHNFTVVDFLNFGIGSLRTGILNVADMSVTFGVIYLIITAMKYPSHKLTKE